MLLDSAAMNVLEIMEERHPRFYDDAFDSDPSYWKAASPFYAMKGKVAPILAVCSTKRDDPCPQAVRFDMNRRTGRAMLPCHNPT